MPSVAPVHRFGRCQLDVGARELRVDGAFTALAPRPFALLAHLVHERHRVVPKTELMDEVWPDRIVTEGALARAVWLVRRAIGDSDERLLQTRHGVGYRFVGEVHTEAATPPDAAPRRAPLVAWLPMEHEAAAPGHVDSALGVVALVGHALAVEGAAWPLPLSTLMAVMQRLGPDAEACAVAAALRAEHEVDVVIRTRVAREPGGYRLDGTLIGDAQPASFTVRAPDPLGLGRKLVRLLPRLLYPQGEHGAPAWAHDDPWAMELLAHALHARATGQAALAEKFCRVLLDHAPELADAVAGLRPDEAARGTACARL
jgi:DNA-binding winged helix-turn-helix (wHTH) protein